MIVESSPTGDPAVVVVLSGVNFRRVLSELSNARFDHRLKKAEAKDRDGRDYHDRQIFRINELIENLQSQG